MPLLGISAGIEWTRGSLGGMLVRSAALIEGLRLEEPLQFGPVTIAPVDLDLGFVGRDGRDIVNAQLEALGFVSRVEAPAWGMQLWPRRKLAVATLGPVAGDVSTTLLLARVVSQVVDLLALSHGGDPRELADVVEISEDDGATWRTLAQMFGSGPYPGSVLERLATPQHPVSPLDPQVAWQRQLLEPRLAVWLRLHRNLVGELRWDVRMFRAFSLLETIARELYSTDLPVYDDHGAALIDERGAPFTTGNARGLVYKLVSDALATTSISSALLLAHPSRTLWDEVEVWLAVRNAVAHEGGWQPPAEGLANPERRVRTAAAFETAGRGDGLEAGWQRYADAAQAATEVALRAAMQKPPGMTDG